MTKDPGKARRERLGIEWLARVGSWARGLQDLEAEGGRRRTAGVAGSKQLGAHGLILVQSCVTIRGTAAMPNLPFVREWRLP